MKIKPAPKFHDGRLGAAIAVRLKPNARSTRIRKIDQEGTVFIDMAETGNFDIDDRLKLFLAEQLGVNAAQMDVIGGGKSNARLVMILGVAAENIEQTLNQLVK